MAAKIGSLLERFKTVNRLKDVKRYAQRDAKYHDSDADHSFSMIFIAQNS